MMIVPLAANMPPTALQYCPAIRRGGQQRIAAGEVITADISRLSILGPEAVMYTLQDMLVHIPQATAAIASGLCQTVLITHGESGRSHVGRTRNVDRLPVPAVALLSRDRRRRRRILVAAERACDYPRKPV
jgi:hypothetical protein